MISLPACSSGSITCLTASNALRLSGGQMKLGGVAQRIDRGMNLRAHASSALSEGLLFWIPFLPLRGADEPDDRRIDHGVIRCLGLTPAPRTLAATRLFCSSVNASNASP